jgi:hypothetical protein
MHTPGRSLCRALAIVLFLSSHWAVAQSAGSPSAVGADRIRTVLTSHPQWTVYWSSLGAAPRPPASAASGTVEFRRRGNTIIGHMSIPAFTRECEFEVLVKDDGFSYPGCMSPQDRLTNPPDRQITYDPNDRDYPFKGTGASYWYWFQPK